VVVKGGGVVAMWLLDYFKLFTERTESKIEISPVISQTKLLSYNPSLSEVNTG